MIAIIDYGLGNLSSISNMFNRLGIDAVVTNDKDVIQQAEKLLLPGVGHFKKGMENLMASGLVELLNNQVLVEKKPILGICLGAQLMTTGSEEGDIQGLNWINARTVTFDLANLGKLKTPHMSWSEVELNNDNPLFRNLPDEPRFYHVHGYHFAFDDPSLISAYAKYGYRFPTAFHKENMYGVQFHPEKSHKFGMKIFQNFYELPQ